MKKFLRLTLVAILSFVFNDTFADAYKTLTFPKGNEKEISSYTATWTVTIGNDVWTIANFNNNKNEWAYIKCGRKDNASVASITSPAIDKAIENIIVTIDAITASKINTIYLEVATDANFSNVIEKVNAPAIEKGDITFKTTKATENCYYKLTFDCAAGTANGLVTVSKVAYYEKGNAPVIVDISNTPETAYTVAKAHELITAGEGLTTNVYVKGVITNIQEISAQYGNATYSINDTQSEENQLLIFRGLYLNNEKFTAEDQIKIGDEVIVYGQLTTYKTEHQIAQGSYIYSLNGQTSGINGVTVDKLNANAPVYNLAGQRVSKDTKGILIQNGKKFINK